MQKTVITQHKTWKSFFKELWDYKDVLFFLTWRDLLVQYKQTVIGVFWVILRPLMTVFIFTIVFNRIAGLGMQNVAYPLIVLSGMLVWQFFADVFNHGSISFLSNVQLTSKVYFPRVFLPGSRLLCGCIDFLITFIFYSGLSYFRYGVTYNYKLLLLIPVFIWLIFFTFFTTIFFALLIVYYRDIRHIIPFILQFGLYSTPVAFSVSMLPSIFKYILSVNPLTGIIHSLRYILLHQQLDINVIGIGLFVTSIIIFISSFYFKKNEQYIPDCV